MRARTSASVRRHALLLSLTLALGACGESAPEGPPDEPPIVGAGEVAISLRHGDAAPSNAFDVEITQTELQFEHHSVYTLENGRVPAGEITPEGLRTLRERIDAAGSRTAAGLIVHGAVPYGTMVYTLQTLLAAGVRTVHFGVRAPNASPPAISWMTFESPRVVPTTGDVTFPSTTRPWADFAPHWQEVYDECRAAGPERYIDCDGLPALVAEGGELQVELFTRGQAMFLRFVQVNVPDAGLPPPPAPRPGEEIPPTPDGEASFSWRFGEAADPESHISTAARPVCGAAACPIVIEVDEETQAMRIRSLLGAAVPDGSPAPDLAWRLPEPR